MNTLSTKTKRSPTWGWSAISIVLALPYAGITQVRFGGSAASVGPCYQQCSPGTLSDLHLCATRYDTTRFRACQTSLNGTPSAVGVFSLPFVGLRTGGRAVL